MHRRQLLLAAGAAPFSSRSQAATTWRLATGYPADTFHGRNIAQFAQDVASSTDGALRIELHADNRLIPLAQIPAAVRSGKAQAGEVIMTGLVKEVPIAGADSVPFIVADFDDAQRLWQFQRPLIERHFERLGLRPLFAVPWPPQCLYTINPITRASDLRGAKMRTYNATTVRIAELLGARAVDVPMSQVDTALAEGRINAMITSAVTGVENQVWSSFKYFYEINAFFPKNLTFVNSQAFADLPSAQQKAVLDGAGAAEKRGWAASRAAALVSMAELKRNGLKVEPSPYLLRPVIRRLGERFSLEWLRDVGPEANEVFIPFFAER